MTNGTVVIHSGNIGGSVLNAAPEDDGRYRIFWMYDVGDCTEYVDKFMDLISKAKAHVKKIVDFENRPRAYRDFGP